MVKTAEELGLAVGSNLNPSGRCPTLMAGNYYVGATAIIGLYPELYQVAQWDKVLTESEMQDQYASSKVLFAAVGI